MSALRELSERMLAGHDLAPGLPVAPGPGERLPGDVLFAPSFANVSAIPTGDGLVLIDAGGMLAAQRAHEDLRRMTDDPVHTVVYTHGHVDHVMGALLLGDDEDFEVVAHERVPARFERYRRTRGWNAVINARQFGLAELEWPSEFREPDRTFHDALDLEIGGVRVELRHARGETDDHLYAWLPDRGVLFCADYFTWSLPNAGNPQKAQRYPVDWAAALRAMSQLGAELAVPGHGPPLFGSDVVRRVLGDTDEALEVLIEQVLERMNAGAMLDEILHSVRLPETLRERPYLRSAYDDEEFVVARDLAHVRARARGSRRPAARHPPRASGRERGIPGPFRRLRAPRGGRAEPHGARHLLLADLSPAGRHRLRHGRADAASPCAGAR